MSKDKQAHKFSLWKFIVAWVLGLVITIMAHSIFGYSYLGFMFRLLVFTAVFYLALTNSLFFIAFVLYLSTLPSKIMILGRSPDIFEFIGGIIGAYIFVWILAKLFGKVRTFFKKGEKHAQTSSKNGPN